MLSFKHMTNPIDLNENLHGNSASQLGSINSSSLSSTQQPVPRQMDWRRFTGGEEEQKPTLV